jgi:hypothetical protein
MSSRSIYFRDQADACWQLAMNLTDAETKEHLREMAVELIERAVEIEGKSDDAPTPIKVCNRELTIRAQFGQDLSGVLHV